MAILIPGLDAAKAAKQKPTEGEVFLLEFLASHFDDQVEVTDWNQGLYSIDDNNKWSVDTGSRVQRVKSPFAQAYAYKKNFFDIHVNGLLENCLKNENFFRCLGRTCISITEAKRRFKGSMSLISLGFPTWLATTTTS